MYTFKIGKPLDPPPVYKDIYKFHLSFMSGDADAYDSLDCYISKEDKLFNRFVEFINAAEDKMDPCEVLDFQFFGTEGEGTEGISEEEIDEYYNNGVIFYWPKDCTSDGWKALLTSITVTYFDKSGIEHEVKMTKKK